MEFAFAELTHRVHDFDPYIFRISDSFGPRWYGLAYVLGFLAAWGILIAAWKTGRSKINPEAVSNLIFYLILGVFLGGRLGYFIFYQPGELLTAPWKVIEVWGGGMASHGAFIGIFVALFIFCRRNKISLFHAGDLVSAVAPIGIFLGRITNFINGELWGKVTDVSWAWIFPQSAPVGTPLELIPARHPSQLYQAGLEGLLLALWVQARLWLFPARNAGQIAGEFFIGYAGLRILGEVFREPDASLILGLSRGTFYSLLVFVAGVVILVLTKRRAELAPIPATTKPAKAA